ncbi:MAG: RDD family protein [Candidatus Hodarchaeales archaeon]|jgi:uncharacterized RDD family membrane protein YckC
MSKKNVLIEKYIHDIDEWLPYPQNRKAPLLENLHAEVIEAIHDTQNPDPVIAYGNPYEIAKGLSLSQEWGMQPASWYIRTFAFTIDVFLILSICLAYLLIGFLLLLRINITQALSIKELGEAFEILRSDLEIGSFLVLASLLILYTFGAVVIYSAYFIILEKYHSATIGKKLLGLQAVDISGIKLTWKQSVLRNFTKLPGIVEFLPFDILLGMLMVEKSQKDYQKATDMLTETIVLAKSNIEGSSNE